MGRVEQLRFAWAEPRETHDLKQVVIDPGTAEVAMTLMARALIAVVRAIQEADDER